MKKNKKLLTVFTILLVSVIVSAQETSNQVNNFNFEITKISDLKKYTSSYIEGEVIKITDIDEFKIKDSSKKIKVYTGWKNTNLVETGQKIIVKGILDPGFFFDEFYASEIILKNGNVIKLKSD